MKRVRVVVPEVKGLVEKRPRRCKLCKGSILQGHGVVRKRVKDPKVKEVEARRYRCVECGSTFREYPEGVSEAKQSRRLMALAVLLWGLGLSHGDVSRFLEALGCGIAKMTSWRDVQEVGGRLRWRMERRIGSRRAEVAGADETVVKMRGEKVVLGFVVDVKRGETLGIEVLLEQDSPAFLRWMRRYAEKLGMKVVVSDDLVTYKPVVDELGVEHQVCLAHVRKNLSRRLKKIEGYPREKEKLKGLVRELPRRGDKQLLEMEREVREEPALRSVVVDLMEKWPALLCHRRVEGVPSTNNATERAIGRSKIRYKTMRGYKSRDGMLNGVHLTQWLHRPRHTLDLRRLFAN